MKNRTYAGIPVEFAKEENSETVLIPVAYDGTSTWNKGADKGPEAFLIASENMELYDIETDSEVYKNGIFLTDIFSDFNNPVDMVKKVYTEVKKFINNNKFVTLIGGEHSVSIGSIRAHYESYNDLTVLQLDAHADLRKEYLGSPYNHACALHEASSNTNLIQAGIRSMDISEKKYMKKENVFFMHDIIHDEFWVDEAIRQMTENVYITLDLDVFDPSIVPSTGTPEPGGMSWNDVISFLECVFSEKNVVGFDITELCPDEHEKSSDFLAAKLYYKMLSYKYFYQNKKENK
jgi:agmatinase